MERARRLIGLPLLTPAGQRLGEISDVLLDISAREIVGLAITTGNFVRQKRYVHRANIMELSGRGAIVTDQQALQEEQPAGLGLHGTETALGRTVVTTGGDGLGSVRDILIQEDKMQVWGFEISDGLMRDLVDGATHLPRQLVQRLDSADNDPTHMNDTVDGKPTP